MWRNAVKLDLKRGSIHRSKSTASGELRRIVDGLNQAALLSPMQFAMPAPRAGSASEAGVDDEPGQICLHM
jgi:hypothetical protein